jgi:hypothetical protein
MCLMELTKAAPGLAARFLELLRRAQRSLLQFLLPAWSCLDLRMSWPLFYAWPLFCLSQSLSLCLVSFFSSCALCAFSSRVQSVSQ